MKDKKKKKHITCAACTPHDIFNSDKINIHVHVPPGKAGEDGCDGWATEALEAPKKPLPIGTFVT